MLNQLVIVGKCSSEVKPFIEDGLFTFSIKVPRTYKTNNVEEEDEIECVISESFLEEIMKYIKVNDIVGVKGYLRNYNGNVRVFAERLTFLNKHDEE